MEPLDEIKSCGSKNCAFEEMRDVVAMVPHSSNPNRHSEKEIDLLARFIRHPGSQSHGDLVA